jgi:Na+/H+ antiporter NhaD/arsenite permease-like protein
MTRLWITHPTGADMARYWLGSAGLFAMIAITVAAVLLNSPTGPRLVGVRAEFLLFALTLVGVALFHTRTFEVALTGLAAILAVRLLTDGEFDVAAHFTHEAPVLVNLLGLLLGFAVLARHFEESETPKVMPRFLPDDWTGGLVLLALIFVLSSFLDNIAAAMIGATVAKQVFRDRLDLGYLAAIVAASNAGGSGSVVGDTTTTMMWIQGVGALDVLHAYVAAIPALLFFGVIASRQQHRLQPIQADPVGRPHVRWKHIAAVVLILVGAIVANILLEFPAAGVWAAILLAALVTPTDWKIVPASLKGSLFLIMLVSCASLMPVEDLPPASWASTFGLGWISAVFDNIPLTKLALEQGGYDWGLLAYAVGFGGSMVWFGSSAGVALTNLFPAGRSVLGWLGRGWHVAVGYALGFFVLFLLLGWNPPAIE